MSLSSSPAPVASALPKPTIQSRLQQEPRQITLPIPAARLLQLLLLGTVIPLLIALIPGLGLAVGEWMMAVYDLGLVAIAFWDFQRAKSWHFDLKRTCESRLSIGRNNLIRLQVTVEASPVKSQKVRLHLREHLPQEFQVDQLELSAQLMPERVTEISYHVFPPRRGCFSWSGIDLRQLSPWGLVWRSWHAPVLTTVEVYPDLVGLRSLSVQLSLEAAGSLRRRRHSLGGTNFSELRDYNLGDDLRLIDWKATARRGRPLIRLMEPERDQPLIILLDRGRLMTPKVAGLQRFDWALNATLSLALAGLRRGDRVGVCVFDNNIHTWIGPRAGQSHLSEILEQLYNLEPVLVESDYIGVVSTLLSQYPRRALVVLLTDLIDATASRELLGAIGQLTPRFLPFCIALRDPQVDAQAHRAIALTHGVAKLQTQSFYEQAVALDLLHQRNLAFAQLKQKGALVLDAPANTISKQLVDRYLLLKARGRL